MPFPFIQCMLLLQPWTSMFLKFVNEFCTFSARFAAITAAISSNFGIEVFVFDRRDLLDMKPCSLYELYLITAYAIALVPIMLSSPNKRIFISRSFSLILVIALEISMKRGKSCSQAIHFLFIDGANFLS